MAATTKSQSTATSSDADGSALRHRASSRSRVPSGRKLMDFRHLPDGTPFRSDGTPGAHAQSMSFLERPEALYEALVSSAREPMAVVNETGIIVLANEASLKLTGHAMHEYLGASFSELVHHEDQ